MKIDIQDIDDLRAERARLQNQLQLSKMKMRQAYSSIKTELSPARMAVGVVGDMFTSPQKGLLNMGVGLGVDMLLRRGLLARAGWITRLAVPFLVRNLASNFISKNRNSLLVTALTWVKNATAKPVTHTEAPTTIPIESSPSA